MVLSWPSGSAFDFVSLQSPKYHGTDHHMGRLLSTEPIGRMHDHNFRIQTLRCILVSPVELRVTLPLKRGGLIPSDMRMKPQTSLHQTQPWVLQLASGRLRAMGDEHHVGASQPVTPLLFCALSTISTAEITWQKYCPWLCFKERWSECSTQNSVHGLISINVSNCYCYYGTFDSAL